ncbi:MAG: chemotaxis-specific protein-glutamate methyltransferase CheB [Acidimicrobiales bacterium]
MKETTAVPETPPTMVPDVRVVVVDDSSVVRLVLREVIAREHGLVLAGIATNGRQAVPAVAEAKPDVVVLDVEMPELDGLGALRELKMRWPRLPVIMFSTLTERGAATTLEALAEGADDYTTKPTSDHGPAGAFAAVRRDLIPLLRAWGAIARARNLPTPSHTVAVTARAAEPEREDPGGDKRGLGEQDKTAPTPVAPGEEGAVAEVKVAARKAKTTGPSHVPYDRGPSGHRPSEHGPPEVIAPRQSAARLAGIPFGPAAGASRRPVRTQVTLRPPSTPGPASAVVIGCSTGGPNALAEAIPAIPADFPVPVLLVQHMPPTFTRMLAERLDSQSKLHVEEARAGTPVQPGSLYVAQGGTHMIVRKRGHSVFIELDDGPPENFCRPSVDVLFRSAAAIWGRATLGVVLTGMGQDGLAGARAITAAGGDVIAQDELSSVVWGMPGAVAKAGLASEVVPLSEVANSILRHTRR